MEGKISLPRQSFAVKGFGFFSQMKAAPRDGEEGQARGPPRLFLLQKTPLSSFPLASENAPTNLQEGGGREGSLVRLFLLLRVLHRKEERRGKLKGGEGEGGEMVLAVKFQKRWRGVPFTGGGPPSHISPCGRPWMDGFLAIDFVFAPKLVPYLKVRQ